MTFSEILAVVLSSSFLSAFVGALMPLILEQMRSRIEKEKVNTKRKYNEEKQLKQHREKIYVDAIKIVQLIKFGFYDRILQDISNMPVFSSQRKEKYEELNNKIREINELISTTTPLLRIYATDEIFELYLGLVRYSRFSYSENMIWQYASYCFERKFTYMCKLIQKDLGVREDNPILPEKHICPKCGSAHNSEENCPYCGISWVEAIDLEDTFNEECLTDGEIQELMNLCVENGLNPVSLMQFPIDKNCWKENMRKNVIHR